jgi:hypothetical protein
MNTESDLPHQSGVPNNYHLTISSYKNPLELLIFILFIACVSGTVWYLLGTRIYQNGSQGTKRVFFQTSPTIVQSSPITAINSAQATIMANWNTYTDVENGFEIKYPANWSRLVLSDKRRVNFTPDIPEPLGEIYSGLPDAIVYSSQIKNCTNSSDYIKSAILPLEPDYPEITIKPLNLANMEGFIAEGLPGQGGPSGPTAFIFRCPRLIQIGFNSTRIENDEQIFNHMLSTLKVWTLKN